MRTNALRGTKATLLSLLRGSGRTVLELAGALGLTGNAVRGHLAALQRDGLAEVREMRRSAAKPSAIYALTPAGEALFPKGHAVVIGAILEEMRARFSAAERTAFLAAVAARLPVETPAYAALEERLDAARAAFAVLGGAAEVETHDGRITIGCHDCPLGDVTRDHADACELASRMVSAAVGAEVTTRCTHGERPACRFELNTRIESAGA